MTTYHSTTNLSNHFYLFVYKYFIDSFPLNKYKLWLKGIGMLSLQVNSKEKLLLGAIQLPSFLIKNSSDINRIGDYAASNALKFKKSGFDGVFIQDTTIGDLSMDVLANLTSITRHVKDIVGEDFAIGSQMECDNAKAILATAKAASCEMVRIKNYVGALLKSNGVLPGQGPEAFKYKIEHGIETNIFADIFNLTGVPVGNLSFEAACGMALKLGVSGLIVCGKGFDETISLLKRGKDSNPNAFILCGGNATEKNVKEILKVCDGVIVSSCLKTEDKKEWDITKIKRFVDNAKNC